MTWASADSVAQLLYSYYIYKLILIRELINVEEQYNQRGFTELRFNNILLNISSASTYSISSVGYILSVPAI